MIELILVIGIIGILAVMVVPNWTHTQILVEFEARRVFNDIRFAQAMSMATGQRYRWVRTSSSSYQITNQAGTPVMLGGGATTQTMTSGSTFGTLVNLPSNVLVFDSRGIPYTDTSIPGTPLASTATIPVTGSSQTANIQITPSTGYGVVS